MTTDRPDDRADVIEQAAQIIRDAKSYRTPDGIRDRATAASLDLKHAGLLSTPADQDNAAEVERLEESLSLLLWELTGGLLSKTNYDVPTMVREIEDYFERTEDNAERDQLRAQVAAVRKLHERRTADHGHDEWCVEEDADWPCATIQALDTAGGDI